MKLHILFFCFSCTTFPLSASLIRNESSCADRRTVYLKGCDYQTIFQAISENLRNDCSHGPLTELQIITGTNGRNEAKEYIDEMCDNAWRDVQKSSFSDIDTRFNEEFINEYFSGGTFLNSETGNFQGRQNPKYPISDESYTAGKSIEAFFKNSADTTFLQAGTTKLENCDLQAMMCCFGRDRQSNDNNGNCRDNDCGPDAGPADNSNLCYTEPSNTLFEKSSEGAIHCHGLAWAEDDNDPISRLKHNNLFFVSMYDHLYTRGYTERTINSSSDEFPMCGCVEDMPPVSRSDCTQVDSELSFTASYNQEGLLAVTYNNDLNIEFNACRGIRYDNKNRNANNDLASYVNKLVLTGKMKSETQDAIHDTLVGYANPNDNNNEEACTRSYCKVEPNNDFCFLLNKIDTRSFALTEEGGFTKVASMDTNSRDDCLKFCELHEVVQFQKWTDGESCKCYSTTMTENCAMPWGDQVNKYDIDYGQIYSKVPLSSCSMDFCEAYPDNYLCFTANKLNTRDVVLTKAGGFSQEMTTNTPSQDSCLKFCEVFDAAQYQQWKKDGESCVCYSIDKTNNEETCALPWGDQVNKYDVDYGHIYSKNPLSSCTDGTDFCDAYPDSELCFTAHKLNTRDVALTEAGGFIKETSKGISSKEDCLQFCEIYDVVQFQQWKKNGGDSCSCYSIDKTIQTTCAMPWGDNVNKYDIDYGQIYSKTVLPICSNTDFCKAYPNSYLCFSANQLDTRKVTLTEESGFTIVATKSISSKDDCLKFCGSYDAVRHQQWADGNEKCICFSATASNNKCALSWGDQVNKYDIDYGKIYSKMPLSECDGVDFCSSNPNDHLCLTANKVNTRDVTLTEIGGFTKEGSKKATSKDDCLKFCKSYDAAQYQQWTNGDSCACFSVAAGKEKTYCAMSWGDKVNKYNIDYGHIYTKAPLNTCGTTFCEAYPNDSQCKI